MGMMGGWAGQWTVAHRTMRAEDACLQGRCPHGDKVSSGQWLGQGSKGSSCHPAGGPCTLRSEGATSHGCRCHGQSKKVVSYCQDSSLPAVDFIFPIKPAPGREHSEVLRCPEGSVEEHFHFYTASGSTTEQSYVGTGVLGHGTVLCGC